jgi:hypothetical protein
MRANELTTFGISAVIATVFLNFVAWTAAFAQESTHTTWYLAEGSTGWGFDTYLLIQNPNSAVANCTATFMMADGSTVSTGFTVSPTSRVTINAADHLGPGIDFSTKVESTNGIGITVERSTYWDGFANGHSSVGSPYLSSRWYLAEGSTGWGFDTYLLIQNPNNAVANCTATFMTGGGPVPIEFTVNPTSRVTVNAAAHLGPGIDFSTKVESTNGIGIVVDRSMFWNGRDAGHSSVGARVPAPVWYLAEGSTGWGFDTYLLIQNPNNAVANCTATFMTGGGPVPIEFTVNPTSRLTINAADHLGPGIDFSTKVESTNGIGITVERSTYWDGFADGHSSVGSPYLSSRWYLAEGSTGWGFDTYLLIQNPNNAVANCTATFMKADGSTVSTGFTVNPISRVAIDAAVHLGPGIDFSTKVESTNEVGIVVERLMFWNGRDTGHSSGGVDPNKPPELVSVTTADVSAITALSATSGGSVTDEGGAPVTARGVCWSTSPSPTIADFTTTNGIGTGAFTSNLTGLTENTLYYVRAYAANSYSTIYGEQKTFATLAAADDDDGDGISNAEEDGAPNGGDGNGDGTPDSLQSHVGSITSATGAGYLVVEIMAGCPQLENVQVYAESSLGSDDYFDYPYGLVGFDLPCSTATVRVSFHGVSDLSRFTYRKFGPLPPGFLDPQWYTLPGATFGTEDIGGQTVAYAEFSLVDGQLGDDTGIDGVIRDQGGPGMASVLVPTMTGWGLAVFFMLMAGPALWFVRRRHLRT